MVLHRGHEGYGRALSRMVRGSSMQGTDPNCAELAEALAVAKGSLSTNLTDGDAKLLYFFLHDGECSSAITESAFAVRYSWRMQSLPVRYDLRLAPAVICRLMQLGGLTQIVDEATFSVGPRTIGIGGFVLDTAMKWVRIRCEKEQIVVLVRDEQKSLNGEMRNDIWKIARCARCDQELRTPLAKQCLHCGYDWH